MPDPILQLVRRLALAGSAWLVAASAVSAPLATLPAPFDLYETSRLPDARLAAIDPGPFRVLHRENLDGTTWLLLALPDGAVAVDVAGERPRYIGRVREGERVILTAPPEAGEERLRSGRSVTITPSGAGVLVSAESAGRIALRGHNAWREADTPLPVPSARPPGPPTAFRDALDRASRARADGDGAGFRTAEQVRTLIARVSLDSLETCVRRLSERASGAPDSRWWDPGAPGSASSIAIKQDYVVAKLEAAFGPGSVSLHGVDLLNGDGETVRVYNIVARKPASVGGSGAGAFLLTAHLDAIGLRSDPEALWDAGYSRDSSCDSTALDTDPDCAWDAERDPAPGADDNGTGIAAMLEAARLLAPLDFDFDLVCVAFTAEEIGLRGSAAYADSVARADQRIFGVLNMDMLGYNADTNEMDVVADGSSEWLADWIVETGQQFVTQLPVEKKVEPFGRSDHASFWSRDIDAILLNEDIRVQYPKYHTFQDTWANTFPASGRPNSTLQFLLGTQLAVATVARFALHQETPDLALPAGELDVTPLIGRAFVRGQAARVTAWVHNYGTSYLNYAGNVTDSLTARVSFYRGHPDSGGVLLQAVTKKDFFGGGTAVPFEIFWDTTNEKPGYIRLFARVEGLDVGYTQEEVVATNNEVAETVFLQVPDSAAPEILNAYAYPNPVRGTQDAFALHYELTRSGDVSIDVFDLGGTQVGSFGATAAIVAQGNLPGPNTVDGSSFHWKSAELESGVYVYVLRATGAGQTANVRGKFAIIR